MALPLLPKPFILGSIKTPLSSNGLGVFDYPWPDFNKLAEEMEFIIDRGSYTKDYPKLCEKDWHYLFTYGTLKKNFRNHYYLGRSELAGCGYTKFDRFFMAVNTRHGYPIGFFNNRVDTRARLYGEIYKVAPETIRSLDYLESNGVMYKRFPQEILAYNNGGEKQVVKAWVYLGIKDFWNTRAEHLQIARKAKPNNGDPDYYHFALADEE